MTNRSKQCTSIILFEYRIRTSNNLSTIISLLNDWSLLNLKCSCLQGRSQRGKLTYDSSIIQNNSKSRPLLEIGKLVHLCKVPHWWVVKILIWFFGLLIHFIYLWLTELPFTTACPKFKLLYRGWLTTCIEPSP